MQEQFDSNSASDLMDSQNTTELSSMSANDDSQEDEHICKHCGGVVPLGAVLCPDCGCWWSRS